MESFTLKIQDHISSAHFLRGYAGKCKELHGHNWKVLVAIKGEKLDSIGMVADFGELKEKLHAFLAGCDHCCLNDIPFFKTNNPTTENIARYIYQEFGNAIAPLSIAYVEVWESDICSVVYTA
jgi:6-pyruvoyltetrahydropterin/6-carboxytetrahydropterin synthase